MKIIFDESYGELSFAQRAAYRKHNVPPALHDELEEYFGAGNHSAITTYVKAVASPEYGRVYRDKPDRITGRLT